MKVTAEMLEAALRRKRLAASEQAGPAKRARREDWGETAVAPRGPEASAPAKESAWEEPTGGAVPAPAKAEPEEGEIAAAIEVVLVDLDPEEVAPATAKPAEVGRAAITNNPLAPAEPGVERTPPPAGVEGMEAGRGRPGRTQAEPERVSTGERKLVRQGAGAGGSSRRSTH